MNHPCSKGALNHTCSTQPASRLQGPPPLGPLARAIRAGTGRRRARRRLEGTAPLLRC